MDSRRHDRFSPAAALASASLLVALTAACTARVLEDAAAPPACASDDDCGAGAACVDDVCAEAEADPVPRDTTIVGPDGGVVYGPDGIVLSVDAGALDGSTAFSITTATATLEYANFTPTTRLYTIDPATTFSGAGVRLSVPAAAAAVAGGPRTLFVRPAPPGPTWDPVEDVDGDGTYALSRTGTFGVGVAIEETP
jgi:hypothetical protein